MACYAGLVLAPAEGFDWGFFGPLGKKRAYYAVLAHFWQFLVCLVVTLVTCSSNLRNFERNPKKLKEIKKNPKELKFKKKSPKINKKF